MTPEQVFLHTYLIGSVISGVAVSLCTLIGAAAYGTHRVAEYVFGSANDPRRYVPIFGEVSVFVTPALALALAWMPLLVFFSIVWVVKNVLRLEP